MFAIATRRSLRSLALLPALFVAAACSDSTGVEDDPAEDVEAISMTVTRPNGTSTTYTFDQNDNPTIALGSGANSVVARFVDGDGATVTLPSTEFRLEFEGFTNGITFARSATNGFQGTITVPAGVTTAQGVALLWHIPSNHEDLEVPFIIQVQ